MMDWLSYEPIAISDFIFKGLIPILLFALGYKYGFRKWLREKETEQRLQRENLRYQSRLEAYRAVWTLLAYMSEKENERTIFVTRLKDENAPKGNTAIFLRTEQAQQFLRELPEVFYTQGHGILLDTETRNDLFNFRRIVYKLLDHARKGKEQPLPDRIEVRNKEVVKAARDIHHRLVVGLRQKLEGGPPLE